MLQILAMDIPYYRVDEITPFQDGYIYSVYIIYKMVIFILKF